MPEADDFQLVQKPQRNPKNHFILVKFKNEKLCDHHMTLLFIGKFIPYGLERTISLYIKEAMKRRYDAFLFTEKDNFGINKDIKVLKSKEKYFGELRNLLEKYNRSTFKGYHPHISSTMDKLELHPESIVLSRRGFEILREWKLSQDDLEYQI